MANKTFNTRVKNKRDTAANWEAVATTFQPLDGELIIVDTSAGKTRFKVGRYDTAKGRLLYYNEIPFADEYLYNDLNESQGKIYDKLKGIDDKSIIESTLEPVAGADDKLYVYNIGLWQFPKTGFYKIKLAKVGALGVLLKLYARITKDDGTTPDDWDNNNLKAMGTAGGYGLIEEIYAQVDYINDNKFTVYRVQFFNCFGYLGSFWVNTYDKTTQKWAYDYKHRVTADHVPNYLTLTKGDVTTKFNGSTAQTVSIPTKTSELTNDNFVSYAEQTLTEDQQNQAKTNLGIDVLTGNTTAITPTQVKEAILAGRSVAITYTDTTYGNLTFTSFGYSVESNVVVANLVSTYYTQYILADLVGMSNNDQWTLKTTELGTATDIDNFELRIADNYVKYFESQTLTDEQKATARTNIGAISSSELVQSDWNQNDTTAKDYIKNKSLEVPYWEEFGTWTTTYSSFEDDGYLAMNAANAILCLEVNNTRFENLTYTSGSYGSFTLGDIDTIGVKISNSGMGSSTNSLTVSETMFPDGVTSAHIYRKSLKKLPLDALPDEIDWVKTIDGDSIVTKNNVDFVKSNSVFGTKQVHADNSSPDFDSTIRNAMLYRQPTNYTIPTSVKVKTFSSTSTLALKHPDDNGRYVNTEEMPYGNTLVGVDFSGKPVLLNPRRPIATSITSSSTNIQYAGAKAVYDYVETAIPTVDNALSDTSTNPVQNKVVKAAIDSKPSAADAVYTATAASTDGVAYTATVSGIDSLTVGASFIMIPNKASTSKAPTLNVNGLGAKPIRRRLSSLTTSLQQGYSTNWIALNKPFTVVYDGTAWVIEGLTKTDGADVYGAVAQATADAKGNNIADTYVTIAMLQSMLPKVTTITLTSNWVGDASPYYQDIALSCVTETSIVDLQPTPEQLNSWQDDGIAFTTLSGNGTVRVYVAGGKPSSAISVQVRVQEVTVI